MGAVGVLETRTLSSPLISSYFVSLLLLTSLARITAQQSISLLINSSQVLSNNSLVSITDITNDLATSLQCLTSRTDCCDSMSSPSHVGIGDWILPSGDVLTRESNTLVGVDFYRNRRLSGIELLRRNNATSPEGMYRCEIPSSSGDMDVVYIGIYVEGNGKSHNMIHRLILLLL